MFELNQRGDNGVKDAILVLLHDILLLNNAALLFQVDCDIDQIEVIDLSHFLIDHLNCGFNAVVFLDNFQHILEIAMEDKTVKLFSASFAGLSQSSPHFYFQLQLQKAGGVNIEKRILLYLCQLILEVTLTKKVIKRLVLGMRVQLNTRFDLATRKGVLEFSQILVVSA
jgi:hypothetical protein